MNKNGLIAVASVDQKITLWDGRSLRQVDATTLSGAPAAFSPDGRLLAAADSADQIRIWDITRKQVLGRPFNGYNRTKKDLAPSTINSLAFTPDGSTILAVDDRGRLRTHPITPDKITT